MRLITIAILFSSSAVVQAHPGHPAVMPQHAHVLFGIDPMYALVLTVIGAVGGVLVAARYRRVRSKIK